jgi:Uma2 family endonuclease
MPDIGRYEALIDGELKERNVSYESSNAAGRFHRRLGMFVEDEHDLGYAFLPDCGLEIFGWQPGKLRFADGGFIRKERGPRPGRGHLKVAPDLVVEVVSPGDTLEELEAKVEDYFRAGVEMIWVAFPHSRQVVVRRRGSSNELRLGPGDTLEGGDVLPGFSCPVADLFLPPVVDNTREASQA